jgi:H+/Cl- antiporter ClcA
MVNGYLVAAAAGFTLAVAGLLFGFAVRNPERYRSQFFGPALVTSLAGFLTSLVWWSAAKTVYRILELHTYDPMLSEKLAQVTGPASMLAVSFGLIGVFSWRLPDLLEWRLPCEHGDSPAP